MAASITSRGFSRNGRVIILTTPVRSSISSIRITTTAPSNAVIQCMIRRDVTGYSTVRSLIQQGCRPDHRSSSTCKRPDLSGRTTNQYTWSVKKKRRTGVRLFSFTAPLSRSFVIKSEFKKVFEKDPTVARFVRVFPTRRIL